jgi:glycosyltransferase involved in cell wall biosynthesis
MITTQILTKNNANTIEETLASLSPLSSKIIVADLGSTDGTVDICKRYGEVVEVKMDDRSKIRNSIVEKSNTIWQLMINPWEVLIDPDTIMGHTQKDSNAKLMIVTGDLIGKELRLWKKGTAQFKRPVYENLEPSASVVLDAMVASSEYGREETDVIAKWKSEEPHAAEPHYYSACNSLANKRYDEFLASAEHYLFLKGAIDDSGLMVRYYIARVQCYIKQNAHKALTNVMDCIARNPLMAEFWCLLGDIYVRMLEFGRAEGFYRNAMIMGSQRLPCDPFPIELSKYEEYPMKMLAAISSGRQT